MSTISDLFSGIGGLFQNDEGNLDWRTVAGLGGLLLGGIGGGSFFSPQNQQAGYQGGIPEYTATRTRRPINDEGRRPGSGGRRYFSDVQFQEMRGGGPVRSYRYGGGVKRMAGGGIADLPKGMFMGGNTDGMADQVPAEIRGQGGQSQRAALSDGEFVIPADVVSHLGNGNSDAGAQVLQQMIARTRQARTGRAEQAPPVNPNEVTPV